MRSVMTILRLHRPDLTTNSGEVSKNLHVIPAPPKILPTKFRHFVNCPELSWSELSMVRSKMVRSLVFHYIVLINMKIGLILPIVNTIYVNQHATFLRSKYELVTYCKKAVRSSVRDQQRGSDLSF